MIFRRRTLPIVERIAVVDLNPADIIVLQVDSALRLEAVQHLSEALEKKFPGNRCCVLAGGAKLSIIRPDGATQDVTG